ncbi:unnamed protein product [Euphydryas editha]|uniref:Uncharacterized protein n=1 Tax=Euphydryas editha TaxID=104508 RepID=A0AAU9TT05_EUPED|nr:unnamed protein product [Euphydryas editha]
MEYSDDENQSQSLLTPKNRIINASMNTYKINTQTIKEDAHNSSENENKSNEDRSNKTGEETTLYVKQCVLYTFDKDLDKRNYYFSNLLIDELQFLPPCMRSEVYINILKYVDALKQQHLEKAKK